MIGSPSRQLWASDLSVKAGIGYEFLSQEYFLDSTGNAAGDSVLENWALTTYYLDDLKARVALNYLPHDDRSVELQATYEQTDEFFRGRLATRLVTRWSQTRFDISAELDTRQRYRGTADFGDSYWQGYGRIKGTRALGNSWSLLAQGKFDGVRFENPADYNYHYYRLGGIVGLQKNFADFSAAEMTLFYTKRQVPDSSDLAYKDLGAQVVYFGFHSRGDIDAILRLQAKDYARKDGRDDYFRTELEVRHRLTFGTSWFTRQELLFESSRFSEDDLANFDYSRLKLSWTAGLQWTGTSVAVGPVFEVLAEDQDSYFDGEDYSEFGIRGQFDLILPTGTFFSVESDFGQRRYDAVADFQSNFYYERLSLIGEMGLVGDLSLDCLLSAEWEWHDVPQDNTRIYLVSSGLAWTF